MKIRKRKNQSFLARGISFFVGLFVRFTAVISQLFPVKIWMFLGRCVGRLLYYVSPKHRKIAEINVRFAFEGEKSVPEMDAIVKGSFEALGMQAFDLVQAIGLGRRGHSVKEHYISIEGWEHYERALAEGKAILLLGGHFGSMTFANAFYAYKSGRPTNFLLRGLDNEYLEKIFIDAGKKVDVECYFKGQGLRSVVRNLKNGEDLIVYADQKTAHKDGVPTTFFGKETTALSLLPSLALKTGSPILPMFIYREEDYAHHRLVFFPPIIAGEGDTLESLGQKQNDALETAIRQQPEQWLWLHRKWGKDHPGLYR